MTRTGPSESPHPHPHAVVACSFLQGLSADGDLDEAFTLLTDDFVSWTNVTRDEIGKEDLFRVSRWRMAFVPVRFVLQRIVVDGDVVVIEAEGTGTTVRGDRYDNVYAYVFEIRDGRIARMREHCDTACVAQVFPATKPRAPVTEDGRGRTG
jgi:uncharacterized protein